MKIIKVLFIMILIIQSSLFLIGKDLDKIIINQSFYNKIKSVNAIVRDEFCEDLVGKEIETVGIVKSVETKFRYGRFKQIEVIDNFSKRNRIKIVYKIFLKETDIPIIEGAKIKFRAKMMVYTPVDSLRKNYIFEAVFIDGTVKID